MIIEKTVTKYVTSDGKEFNDETSAAKHEVAYQLACHTYGEYCATGSQIQTIEDMVAEKEKFDELFSEYFKEPK